MGAAAPALRVAVPNASIVRLTKLRVGVHREQAMRFAIENCDGALRVSVADYDSLSGTVNASEAVIKAIEHAIDIVKEHGRITLKALKTKLTEAGHPERAWGQDFGASHVGHVGHVVQRPRCPAWMAGRSAGRLRVVLAWLWWGLRREYSVRHAPKEQLGGIWSDRRNQMRFPPHTVARSVKNRITRGKFVPAK